MTPVELSRTVLCAVRSAVDAGELRVDVPVRVVVEPSRPGGRGDYATNVALRLARSAGRPAPQVAEVIRRRLTGTRGLARVDITGPGFLNLTLDRPERGARELIALILREGGAYGHGDAFAGRTAEQAVADEARAEAVGHAVVRLITAQGGRSAVRRAAPGERAVIRPVPAPDGTADGDPQAVRWSLLHAAPHDTPRPWTAYAPLRAENPLFRVRYAHSRTHALRRNARDLGFAAEPGELPEARDGASGQTLVRLLAAYPRTLTAAATHQAPDRLARHLVDLADAYLRFQGEYRVLPSGDEKPSAAHRARLALAEAVGTVLAGGLTLLGIHAPEHL
ncbi:ArgS-related anticodon-binding protein NrtL [Streptomyces uncialis]|uniref:ArgS-related anticodon-binding protein NrtL n=1 Tax=Streptomyces uncialis TaxID=1048205 RepID=UPI00381C9B91